MNIKNKKRIVVVTSHDAGGSEVVSSYVNKYRNKYDFKCLILGPAIKIFKKRKINFQKFNLEAIKNVIAENKIAFVLTGTSWQSTIELDLIKLAKNFKIRTVVYLDHWVNYRERFNFPDISWQDNLPDEIWAGDKYALSLSRSLFKKTKIKLVPNQYFAEIKSKYRAIERVSKNRNSILLISEPLAIAINKQIKKEKVKSEIVLLDEIISCLAKNSVKQKIIIRNHPSEDKNKYNGLVKKYSSLVDVSISKNNDLLNDIARSSIMVGFESMALIIGRLCGKKVVSYLPNKKSKLPLPFCDILKIKKANEILPYLNNEKK